MPSSNGNGNWMKFVYSFLLPLLLAMMLGSQALVWKKVDSLESKAEERLKLIYEMNAKMIAIEIRLSVIEKNVR